MSAAAQGVAQPGSQQEAAAALAAAGAAQSAWQALLDADIAKYRGVIATLQGKYAGKRGRYPSGDSRKRSTAEEALKYLLDGFTLQEGRDNAAAERRRLAAEAQASRAAAGNAQHHAAKPDGRQHSGAAAAAAAAPRRGAAADQPPDDDENVQLPEDVDKLYFVASAAQKVFNAWAQNEALHSRGGENIGGGFWRYAPKHFVQLGGASDTVGVESLVVYDPQRTYGCERGVCPVHGWDSSQALGTAGLTRTCETSNARSRARARANSCNPDCAIPSPGSSPRVVFPSFPLFLFSFFSSSLSSSFFLFIPCCT